jgi:hypothetical protein
MEKTMIGKIVIFRLTEEQKAQIGERRRTEQWISGLRHGTKVFEGNPPEIADEVPFVIVRVWPNEFGQGIAGVNGQALLDGNDSYWVKCAKEGPDPGMWHWPEA